MKRKEDLKKVLGKEIVEYYRLKRMFERLEKKKKRLRVAIVNKMKTSNITDIQIGKYHGKIFRKAIFLSEEKVAKINELLPQIKVIKPVRIFIIDKGKIKQLLKKGIISPEIANYLEQLGEEDFLEVNKID